MENQWIVIQNNEQQILNNIDYLNFLLKQSKEAIKTHNKMHMTIIKWNLEEIKEFNSLFYTLHKLQIDSEIKALRRIEEYELRQTTR